MRLDEMDLDWGYLLERVERLLDLGEEYLSRRLEETELDPAQMQRTLAFRWQRESGLEAVDLPDLPDLADLLGIDPVLERLRQNTRQFVHGCTANNVLLWGERGAGKSSAVKGLLREFGDAGLRLVEVHKEELFQLPQLARQLRPLPQRFILFCDDLSFDEREVSYRELKALLEGSIEARPKNTLIYATSNRRHLLPEQLRENVGDGEIHPEEAIAEKLSLADRFGISLGFYPMGMETFLAVVRHLAARRRLTLGTAELERQARDWAFVRGAISGRVARQFIDDLDGRLALQAGGHPVNHHRRSRGNLGKSK